MGLYRGLDTDEGWIQRKFAELDQTIAEVSAASRLVVATAASQLNDNSMDLTPVWVDYLTRTFDVPVGYNQAIVTAYVSAGTFFSGTGAGNVGVSPKIGILAGPALAQGKTGGGAVSVTSAFATRIIVDGTFDPSMDGSFDVVLRAYANGDPQDAGSGNVHLSCTVMFVRG